MRSLHTFLLISDAIVHSYYDGVTTVTGFAHPEGSMHQFCRQHLEVHRNAEIKLVCSESYYDRLLLYAADQWSTLQRVAPCLTLQNVCSGTYGELGLNTQQSWGTLRYILRMLQLLLTEAIRHAHYAVTPLRYTRSTKL